EELASFLVCFWQFTMKADGGQPYLHHVPPDGCTSLIVRYGGDGGPPLTILFGPQLEPHQVSVGQGDRFFGCRFQPQAAGNLLGLAAPSLTNVSEPAGFRLPKLVAWLAEHLPAQPHAETVHQALTTVLASRLESATPVDPLASAAVREIVRTGGDCSITGLARAVGLSVRHLQRRFRNAVGISPKQFCRIRRFRSAAAELLRVSPRSWINVAYEYGFSDQAHLAREFSQLIGLTAQELRQRYETIEHIDVDP
ncbi:MAG: helix-turn-helix transcriptional regulator, partial [Pirellulales bacterium]|nr:helix-turn-helix transcriptional regulator [Pirellulales bacterium]